MAEKQNELKLIRMNEVEATTIDWLWYPYIPFGKITVIQGDPGDGKTTAMLAIAAAVTTGAALPESGKTAEPMSVIFQTAEDGLGDTVKPRLVQSGADCERVIVIDESELTVGRIKGKPYTRAIVQGKNNLAPECTAIGFELDPATGFRWVGTLPITIDELLSGVMPERDTTYEWAISFLKKELADGEQLAAVLDKKIEKKEIRLEKLNEKIIIKEKAASTVAEIEAMGKPALLGGFNVTVDDIKTLKTLAKKSVAADEKISDMKRRLTETEKERDQLKAERMAAKKDQPTISEHLTWFNKFMTAFKRAPKRLREVIEDILRQPPEHQEQQPASERKRAVGIEIEGR